MGNTHTSGKGPLDYTPSMVKGYPMKYHHIHSPNVKLSGDKRTARRIESFCKGICFGDRPVAPNERIYIRFAEISTSWSGVMRFGFTSVDPVNINPADLPRYACPDLTNKPGYWAKALPERMAEEGNVLFFYITRQGNCMFGLNNKEKGVFFSGVNVNNFLYPLVDIYGNTMAMEFVDGAQISSEGSFKSSSDKHPTNQPLHPLVVPPYLTPANNPPNPQQVAHPRSMSALPPSTPEGLVSTPHQQSQGALHGGGSSHSSPGNPFHYAGLSFNSLPFHSTVGRNIQMSPDRTVVVRLKEEYCNGYVFSSRPLKCGEKLVIQILSVDRTYVGGLAFGMTACDPSNVNSAELPDDSDLLLDRPEYWIVNKDVYSNPEIGDELCFHLNNEGQVVYGRNGHTIATLMHIDKTLPMWPFFDVYGTTQKIKCLGVSTSTGPSSAGSLQVTLPPSRTPQPSSSLSPLASQITVPPRPPPPRNSPGSLKNSPRGSPVGVRHDAPASCTTPPTLPPKQNRPHSSHSQQPHPPLPASQGSFSKPPSHGLSLPPPLIPVPISTGSAPQPPASNSSTATPIQETTPPPKTETPPPQQTSSPQKPSPTFIPPIPPRQIDKWTRATPAANIAKPAVAPSGDQSQEALDNASNECCVCLENPPNCVLYTCGHMCMCFECAGTIRRSGKALCPICCQEIKDVIKIFRS